MTQSRSRAASPAVSPPPSGEPSYGLVTIVTAFVAALATGLCLILGIPLWAMFIGWVAYFTRMPSAAEGLWSFACLTLGLVLAAVAALAAAALAPMMGFLALPIVVFVAAVPVLSARGLPVMNNLLAYFLGLISFFAAGLPPTPAAVLHLAGAAALGLLAGWAGHSIEALLPRRAAR